MVEAERIKPRSLYVEEAIAASLESRWQEALAINRALVERHGADEETHNRVGKALTELGEHRQALAEYSKSLAINPLNLIAQKNVRKLQLAISTEERVAGATGSIDVDLFAEEPGKSALTVLTPPKSGMSVAVAPGDIVELHPHNGGLQAQTARGVVLGDVDSKIARRLLPLIATGNKYTAAVARIDEKETEVIVREALQSSENARKSSFPISRQKRDEFRPYTKESLLATRGVDDEDDGEDDVTSLGDDEPEVQAPGGLADAEFPEAAPLEEADDDKDEDERPEDHY